MKLNAFHRPRLVSQSHNQPIRCCRRDLQRLRQTVLLDYKRVVPRGLEPVRQAVKNGRRIVTYFGGLAMHQVWRANDAAAECFADRLIPETYSEYGKFPGKLPDRVDRNARIA